MKKQHIVLISAVFLILLFVLGVYLYKSYQYKETRLYGTGKCFNLCQRLFTDPRQ